MDLISGGLNVCTSRSLDQGEMFLLERCSGVNHVLSVDVNLISVIIRTYQYGIIRSGGNI